MNHDGCDSPASCDFSGLKPGTVYTVRAWVRAESGTTLAALAVCDPNYNAFVWTGVYTVGTTWQMLSVTFTANSMGVARVHLAKHDITGAQLWDDVELVNGATVVKLVRPAYYPYGQEMGTVTENDTAKFGTYTRDAATGLDYAMNRYYQSTWGRFTSPDPYRASGGPGDPGSWNRYSYVQGDPVNYGDPSGLDRCMAGGPCIFLPPPQDPAPNNEWAHFMVNYNSQSPARPPVTDPNRGDAGLGAQPSLKTFLRIMKTIESAVDHALKALKNPDCAGLFNVAGMNGAPGLGMDPMALLRDIFFGNKGWIAPGSVPVSDAGSVTSATVKPKIGSFNLPGGSTFLAPVGAIITINWEDGTFVNGNRTDQAVTVLHELGHAFNFIYGAGGSWIQGDAGDTQMSMWNSALVRQKCF